MCTTCLSQHMKYPTLLPLFAFLLCLTQIYCQQQVGKCVRCTPCGEQKGLDRLAMQKVASGDGDQWTYAEGGRQWTSVIFATSQRKNFLQTESGNQNFIYIIELLSSDIGAQPEYYWIDSSTTDLCEIAALEHPRRGYHQFNTMIYRKS